MEKYCFSCFKPCEGDVCPSCGYRQGSNFREHPLALPEGSVLAGRYIVGKVLGQGGFGITYVALDYKTKQLVAIKEFFPNSVATRTHKISVSLISKDCGELYQSALEKFMKEARTLAEFNNNPNIVSVYAYFEENQTAYIAMEYLEGGSFLEYLRQKGRISWKETKTLLAPIMDALLAVHSKGAIHRDISPDNIFICKDGTLKLIDFGAARYSLGKFSQTLTAIVKHHYAPFEQYSGKSKQGPFTDVYALAATMYVACTGVLPPLSIERVVDDELVEPRNYCHDISEKDNFVLMKALSVKPEDRYQTVSEFKEALNKTAMPEPTPEPNEDTVLIDDDDGPTNVTEREVIPKPLKQEKKKTGGIIIAALVAVLLAIGVGLIVINPFKQNGGETAVNQEIKSDFTNKETVYDGVRYKLNDSEVYVEGFEGSITSANIVNNINGYPVTRIGTNAFKECTSLESVTVPDSVTDIGYKAFAGCSKLTSISLPDNMLKIDNSSFDDTAYRSDDNNWENGVLYIGKHLIAADGKTEVDDYKIKEGTLTIAPYAFGPFAKFKNITIPKSVKLIDCRSFSICRAMININVDSANTDYSSYDGVLYNKDKTELIKFAIGRSETSFTVPDGVEIIGGSAFEESRIQRIYLSGSVKTIGESAFNECKGIKQITIPNGVETIEAEAFKQCNNLTDVSIPESVSFIEYDAFNLCDNLISIKVDASNKEYSSLDGNLYNKNQTELIQYAIGKSASSFTVPEGVIFINTFAFWCCKNLKSVTISEGVSEIKDYAFDDCENLQSVSIPDSMDKIGYSSFGGCAITEVSVPKSCGVNKASFDEGVDISYR